MRSFDHVAPALNTIGMASSKEESLDKGALSRVRD